MRILMLVVAFGLALTYFVGHNQAWPLLVLSGVLAMLAFLPRRPPQPVEYWTEDMVQDDDPAKRQIMCDVMNTGRMMCGTRDDFGNLFYERGVSGSKEVVPMNEPDRSFLRNAQGMTCGSIVLPSGLTLPKEAGKVWRVVEDRLVLQDEQDIS